MAVSLLVCAAVAGCASRTHPSTTTALGVGGGAGAIKGPRPRLVVLLIIDQLPEWAFAEKRPYLTAGFDRLLREGEWRIGQHPSPATLTAPGHALLGSGQPPSATGVLANEWWNRDLERVIKSVDDPNGGSSAYWLRVPALGDAVAAAGSGAKAVSVSLKARAAILPLGRAGVQIWYDATNTAFTSNATRPWLAEYSRVHPVAAHLRDVWTPLDPARLATLSKTIDNAPGEIGEKGFGPTFPHALGATKNPADAIFAAPVGNQLVFEVATAAIEHEQLGRDATPDLLVLSMSAHDYVGHGWGHESWESWDMLLRLDDQLGRFMASLDAVVGADGWSMIVTSDHGASPLPERIGGGRITYESIKDAANRAACTELGTGGQWIAAANYPTVYLSAAARARPRGDLALAVRKIMLALRSFPGIEQVGLTADFAGRCERRTGRAQAICWMLDPERSGEIFYLPRAGWTTYEADEPTATAHGSFQDYDREVPILLRLANQRAHAAVMTPSADKVPLTQIAPLVAELLGIKPPSALPPPVIPPLPAPAPAPTTAPPGSTGGAGSRR